MTWAWVEGFLNVSKAFRRVDGTEGTYLKDIQVSSVIILRHADPFQLV